MIKIFLKMKEQYIKTEMSYPVNFWMMLISGVVMRGLMMAVPFVIYRNIPAMGGWLEAEVYLMMAFMFISEALCNLLFEGIWQMPGMVFRGEFDAVLARPVSPLFQILSYGMGLQGIGVLALGSFSLFAALHSLGRLNVQNLLLCLFFVVCGTVIRMSVYLLSSSIVFWFESGGSTNIPFTVYSVGEYAKYPTNIYPVWMQIVLLFVIPFGFIGYVPALILRDTHAFGWSAALLGISIAAFLLARLVFYRGIRRYESMGM